MKDDSLELNLAKILGAMELPSVQQLTLYFVYC